MTVPPAEGKSPQRRDVLRNSVVSVSRQRSNAPLAVVLAGFLLIAVGLLIWAFRSPEMAIPEIARFAKSTDSSPAEIPATEDPPPAGQTSSDDSIRRRDELAWIAAVGRRTIEGYQAYLAAWPGGVHAAEAADALRVLEENAALRERAARIPIEQEKAAPPQEERAALQAPRAAPKPRAGRRPGDVYRDCPECPEMVVIPTGRFFKGNGPAGSDSVVQITRPFAVGVYEVTFAQWDACVEAGGCGGYRPDDEGWGRGNQPAVGLAYKDAEAYVVWLSNRTGKRDRFLSENEWEYVARAGAGTSYWWGEQLGENNAACDGCTLTPLDRPAPVGSFGRNAFGLYDVHGNVWEWVEDCYSAFVSASITQEARGGLCDRRIIRGGAWNVEPAMLRAHYRLGAFATDRGVGNGGLRVAAWLDP